MIDWFIPESVRGERTELPVWRNFVFTHFAGPLLCQAISIFLYEADTTHGFAVWAMIIGIWAFWALPFVLKLSQSITLAATLSVQMLCLASLFGSFFYGGVNSPFMPWILVAVLLGFFYLSERPKFVALLLACNIASFATASLFFGFPEIVPHERLTMVGWITVTAGTIYMAWMAMFYASVMSMRSQLQRETELHRQTSKRLQVAKEVAERISRAKSVFLARMSHELRTPLNAVIGYSEILLEDLPQGGDEQRRSDLQRINGAGKHLLSLVTEVLDITKIERNAAEIKTGKFDVAALINEIIATCDSLARVKKNKLVLRVDPGLGVIDNDAVKFRQILLNLLSNAAKFSSNGLITIAAARAPGGACDMIEMSVSDTGIGMSEQEISRLFKRFSQASSEIERQFGGSGLGLSICAHFCALMGGRIGVTSEVGKGSRFTVWIPSRPPSTDRADADETASTFRGFAFAN
jgi:signal transduction histidine kinase